MYFPQFLIGMLATSVIAGAWAYVATGSVWKSVAWAFIAAALLQAGYFKGLDIRSLQVDERDGNKIWVSSAVGLIEFNSRLNTAITYKTTSGLANDYVYGVLEDKKRNLWISTNGGLSYFDR